MKLMKTWIGLAFCAALVWEAVPAGASGSFDSIRVMTRNQYLGADLTPVILAQTPAEFVAAATAALNQIALNNFPLRAHALAREVQITRPHVIGLQEVFDFTINGFNIGPPFVDHLQATLAALAARGLHYEVAGTVEHLDVTVPLDANADGTPDAVRVLDRDVILVKRGVPFTTLSGDFTSGGLCGVPIPNPAPIPPLPPVLQTTVSEDGCNYTVAASVDSPLGLEIVVERGFLGVDVTVRGRDYRVINTHLEVQEPAPGDPTSGIIQSLQSVELAGTILVTTPRGRKLIALGDFNSSAEDLPIGPIIPPYQVLTAAGLADAWNTNLLKFFDPDGFTCCQDSDLANTVSLLDERIDLIFTLNARRMLPLAFVTGRRPIYPLSTPPNWGSDHGGVFGRLIFWGH